MLAIFVNLADCVVIVETVSKNFIMQQSLI